MNSLGSQHVLEELQGWPGAEGKQTKERVCRRGFYWPMRHGGDTDNRRLKGSRGEARDRK